MVSATETREKDTEAVQHLDVGPDMDGLKPADLALDAAAKGQVLSGYEALTPWETVCKFKVCTAACFFAAFSAATDGYQIAMNASIVANKGFIQQFATQVNSSGAPVLASPILSAWSSTSSAGQVVGMTTLPFLSSRFGRKAAMYTYWLVLVSSVLAESLAPSWPVWLVAKFLAGVGVGCLQSTIPTYISEVAPPRIRGGLLMFYSFWWTLGSFFAHVALQVLSAQDPYGFRIPIYTQWAQIGLMLLIYVFLPESPAWCVTRGETDRAKKALATLNRGVEDFNLEQQYQVLLAVVQHERDVAAMQRQEKWYAIFRGTDGRRTITSMWTNLTQQFIGLTLFSTFGTYFFQQAGLQNAFAVSCITSSINIATIICIVLVADRLGRRWIACWGTTLSWLACIAIGILGVVTHVKASDYLLVLFACLWNIGVTANGATGWGYIGEISSQRLRPYTAGFSAACTAIVGIIMSVLTPYMVNTNQWNWSLKTGWFYAGVGLPFMIGVWLLIPETAGRTAAELDELSERKIKPWRFAETETASQHVVRAYRSQ